MLIFFSILPSTILDVVSLTIVHHFSLLHIVDFLHSFFFFLINLLHFFQPWAIYASSSSSFHMKPYEITNIKACVPLFWTWTSWTMIHGERFSRQIAWLMTLTSLFQATLLSPNGKWWTTWSKCGYMGRSLNCCVIWFFGKLLKTSLRTTMTSELANEIHTNTLKDRFISEYCSKIKVLSDLLANIGSPVAEKTLVTYLLNGLSLKYDNILIMIHHKLLLPTFSIG